MDEKEKNLYAAILIVSIVLGVIITYFIISILRQHKKNLLLYQENIHKEITTLEKERARMAADLHDELGPILSSVKLRVSSLDTHTKEDEIELHEATDKIDDLIKRMREITFNLMPTSLTNYGLVAAVNEFITYYGHNNKLKIKFQHSNIKLAADQSINLYRIIQEIIHNTTKHANATNLLIDLGVEKNNCVLMTKDDGIGFNYQGSIKDSSGRGLQNLLSRTEILGGKMFVNSKKGKGTTYIFEVPIKKDAIKTNQDHPS